MDNPDKGYKIVGICRETALNAMEEYSKLKYYDLIEKIENGLQPNNFEHNKGIYYAINVVKQAFELI